MALPPAILFLINFRCRLLLRRRSSRFHLVIEVRSGQVELINHSLIADEIDFPTLIGGERRDVLRRRSDLADNLKRAVPLPEAKDAARRVVAADVDAIERGA